jgi:hypothetical protein
MRIEEHIKFPCGYEFDRIIILGLFEQYNYHHDGKLHECPLHGKNCKKGEKSKTT